MGQITSAPFVPTWLNRIKNLNQIVHFLRLARELLVAPHQATEMVSHGGAHHAGWGWPPRWSSRCTVARFQSRHRTEPRWVSSKRRSEPRQPKHILPEATLCLPHGSLQWGRPVPSAWRLGIDLHGPWRWPHGSLRNPSLSIELYGARWGSNP
jgi:hypothetical protein